LWKTGLRIRPRDFRGILAGSGLENEKQASADIAADLHV
jgi:hypothetical protein